MTKKNITVLELTKWLSEIPNFFLTIPKMDNDSNNENKNGKKEFAEVCPNVKSIISDLYYNISNSFTDIDKLNFLSLSYSDKNENYLRVVLMVAYLFSNDLFKGEGDFAERMVSFLKEEKFKKLSDLVKYDDLFLDSDRKEELVRFVLQYLEILPINESENYFLDRLEAIDSIKRAEVVEKSRLVQERAKKIREEIERKRLEELAEASKMSRE